MKNKSVSVQVSPKGRILLPRRFVSKTTTEAICELMATKDRWWAADEIVEYIYAIDEVDKLNRYRRLAKQRISATLQRHSGLLFIKAINHKGRANSYRLKNRDSRHPENT